MFDEEHKTLLGIMADLQHAITRHIDERTIRKIVHDLVEYTFTHCRHEEMYFNDFRYPRADEHIRQHSEMRTRVLSYYESVRAGEAVKQAPAMLAFLENWLITHVQREDKEFGQYLCSRLPGL